jgi:hypothetical protein
MAAGRASGVLCAHVKGAQNTNKLSSKMGDGGRSAKRWRFIGISFAKAWSRAEASCGAEVRREWVVGLVRYWQLHEVLSGQKGTYDGC